ncbi:SLC13 family permease [Aliamphritea spongicola]|uniref:SLC13 family permease n=1 Tax=Aliamphritea spongicola TaxID=707589 RepID=UPI00196B6F05|nr:SLC13 family permease [Aliamphritea spongicola]MBN3561993.1 anion permease [Aliamphritea spongicola]
MNQSVSPPETALFRPFAWLFQKPWQIALTVTLALSVVWGLSGMLPVNMAIVAGLSIFCIGLWATAALPEYWPALVFFLVGSVLQLAPAQVTFSGFYSSGFWLLFSGVILGAAIRYTGLGNRAGALLSRVTGRSYTGTLAGIVAFGLALAFIMPSSMGRIALFVPLVVALADSMGYAAGSNGRTGMVAAAAFGTWLPAFTILPSNLPNMMLAGMAETLYGVQLTYWEYLVMHFPVLGAGKAVLLVLLIRRLFPDRAPDVVPIQAMGPASRSERRLMLLISLCLILWITDSLHQVSPGWIGLAAALVCLWPYAGLTARDCIHEAVKIAPLVFIAAMIGLGAVISHVGLGAAVVETLSGYVSFSPDNVPGNLMALTGISTLVAMLTNLPGVPAVMTPLAAEMARLTGISLGAVLMTQVLAFSNVFLPYQAPPLVAAMQLGKLPLGRISLLCVLLFVITLLVLTPLSLLWWYVTGSIQGV